MITSINASYCIGGNMSEYKIKAIVFDWGDTLMRDYIQFSGPMVEWPQVDVMPGVKDAMSKLYKSYICCVASNAGDSDVGQMRLALARVGIEKYFKKFFTSQELGAKKPDKKFYQEILEQLNLNPCEVIVVGNDYYKDIEPAKSVGMWTILISETKNTDKFPSADYLIKRMDELNYVISKI